MSKYVKLVVFAPETYADKVRNAMGNAGAGKIGNYSFCSFSVKGMGRFKPENGANPVIGEVGKLETVAEERIEVLCEKGKIREVMLAIKKFHPYEKIVLDIYPLEDVGCEKMEGF